VARALAHGAAEVFVQRKKRVRLDLGESPSKRPFNSIDRMKEVSAVHLESPGAELPVCPQKEVKPEEPMIFVIEHAPAYQTEVGHVFFLLSGIDATPARAATELPGNRTEGRTVGDAIPEARQAGPKNGSEDTVAWRSFGFVDNTRPVAFAILAGFRRNSNRSRSIPLHF
jgi:hypothetical protein